MGIDFPASFRLVLASQSPRRHSLLRDVGVPFSVVASEAVELLEGDSAAVLAQVNAKAKVDGAVLPPDLPTGTFVLGTDTLVTVDGVVMGKPATAREAVEMISRLSGRVHQVVSGVALCRTGGETCVAVATTDVAFRRLDAEEIRAYVDLGEWRGKAGGYAIQGLAAFFASEVRGEYSNVVGLPLCLLGGLFREQGFDLMKRRWLSGDQEAVPR